MNKLVPAAHISLAVPITGPPSYLVSSGIFTARVGEVTKMRKKSKVSTMTLVALLSALSLIWWLGGWQAALWAGGIALCCILADFVLIKE
jgi:hypothetical protein